LNKTKPFSISKLIVMEAYRTVKANAGAAGIDKQTIADFERNLKDNLYKIWNRMSSGSYYPSAVRAVPIPKKDGGQRILGIATVSDRIAQTVIKMKIEPEVEPIFYEDSYGYRPNKSAIEAVGVTRERCWKYDWCLEFDIKGLFDNLDHGLLMKAVNKHVTEKWVLLYIQRCLEAPMQMEDGMIVKRTRGTPQGSAASAVLSNLFLHYVFDSWMQRNHAQMLWCRYADDGLVHCKTEKEAKHLLQELHKRFGECQLELHPEKTKIIYCKDGRRKASYENTKFDFLGFTYERRTEKDKWDRLRLNFTPAVSKKSLNAMREKTRKQKFVKRSDLKLEDIAKIFNPVLRGWINYYGRYSPSKLNPVLIHFNATLRQWIRRKYRKLASKTKAGLFLAKMHKKNPTLFVHWERRMINAYA
jgi:RNA-directed DNA polymerase